MATTNNGSTEYTNVQRMQIANNGAAGVVENGLSAMPVPIQRSERISPEAKAPCQTALYHQPIQQQPHSLFMSAQSLPAHPSTHNNSQSALINQQSQLQAAQQLAAQMQQQQQQQQAYQQAVRTIQLQLQQYAHMPEFQSFIQQYNNAYVQLLKANAAQNPNGNEETSKHRHRLKGCIYFAGANMGHLQISFMQRALQQWNRHLEQLKLQRAQQQQACAAQFPTMSQHYEGGPRQAQPSIGANGGAYAAPIQQFLQQSSAPIAHNAACNAHIPHPAQDI